MSNAILFSSNAARFSDDMTKRDQRRVASHLAVQTIELGDNTQVQIYIYV